MTSLIKQLIAVAIGGSLGSMLRFGLSYWVQDRLQNSAFPWGILAVNLLGCLLMGIVTGLFIERFDAGPIVRAGLMIGVLGGFTTFSSFSLDTLTLLQSGDLLGAFANLFVTLAGCLLSTLLGLTLVRVLL